MSLADFLTVLRLILVPFFLVSFLMGHYMLAFVLFTVAGGTDLIDGSIARLLKSQTKWGAFWDPIADKALMMTTVTCLLILKILPLWFFLLVFGRDCMILGGLGYMKLKKIEFELEPVLASKISTLSNIITVVLGFLSYLKPSWQFLAYPLHFWFGIFLWVSTVLVLVSGGQYAWAGWGILRKQHQHISTSAPRHN